MMTSLNVPVVVVYDGRRLVGMLTDRDIGLNRRVQEAPQDTPISGFMRTSVPCCLEDDLLGGLSKHPMIRGPESQAGPAAPVENDGARAIMFINRHDDLLLDSFGFQRFHRRLPCCTCLL